MKFQFIGDKHGEGPEFIEFMGQVEFELDGEFVEVESPAVIKKLEGNACFIAEGEDRPAIQPRVNPLTRESMEDELADMIDQMKEMQARLDQQFPKSPAKKTAKRKTRKPKAVSESKDDLGFPGDD